MRKRKVIKFTKKGVREYLDKAIDYWRIKRDKEDSKMARYYMDAFQSVRMSLFDRLKS